MEKVANYLIRRAGVYYYQRRIPKHLIEAFGNPVFKVSLQTKSLSEAKKARTLKDLEFDALVEQLESGPPPINAGGADQQVGSLDSLLTYVRRYVSRCDEKSAVEYLSDPPKDESNVADLRGEAETVLAVLQAPNSGQRDQMIRSATRSIYKIEGFVAPPLSPELAELVRRALVELYRRKLDRYDDLRNKSWHDALFELQPSNNVTVAAHAEAYLEQKEEEWAIAAIGVTRRKKVRAILPTLVELLGKETVVSAIGDEEVQKLRLAVAKLPANRTKLYPGESVNGAIALGAKDGRKTLDRVTQGEHLNILKELLATAVKRKLLTTNPADGIKPVSAKAVSAENARLPFNKVQMVQFFTGTFYQTCAPGAVAPYSKGDRSWRFWMPLLMAFNGSRPNEVAQLTVADVRLSEKGHWYLDLINDDELGSSIQVKTASSRRRAPLHPELKKIGFISFVEQRKKGEGSSARLFPSLTKNANGNTAHYACRRFRDKFLAEEIALLPRQSFYSLRHNARDALRKVHAPDDALRAICGWASAKKAVSDFYGNPNDPDLYVDWVGKIEYEGLDLSFLHLSG